jgi:hypothetical protein
VDEGPSDTWSHSIVFHEYVHFLVERQVDYLPLWLNEGFAEFYGTSSVEKERVLVGRAAPWNLQLLQTRAPLPIEALLAADASSPLYNEQDRASIFYGQSWVVVHYLMHADRGANAHAERPAASQRRKNSFSVAWAPASLKAFERQVASYVRGFQYFMRPVPTPNVPAERSVRDESGASRRSAGRASDAARGLGTESGGAVGGGGGRPPRPPGGPGLAGAGPGELRRREDGRRAACGRGGRAH